MELTMIGYILGFYWNNGEENGNYYNYIFIYICIHIYVCVHIGWITGDCHRYQ